MRKVKITTRAMEHKEYFRFCDFCGESAEHGSRVSRHSVYYDDSTVTIRGEFGTRYPEDEDCRERLEIDCCPECFKGKVIPAIENLGVKFRREDNYDLGRDAEVVERTSEIFPVIEAKAARHIINETLDLLYAGDIGKAKERLFYGQKRLADWGLK